MTNDELADAALAAAVERQREWGAARVAKPDPMLMWIVTPPELLRNAAVDYVIAMQKWGRDAR